MFDADWAANCDDNNGGCEHQCQQTTLGAKCSCHRGYTLLENGRDCADIDECGLENVCSQICLNTPGSFKCDCTHGYVLKPDGKGCKTQGTTLDCCLHAQKYQCLEIVKKEID